MAFLHARIVRCPSPGRVSLTVAKRPRRGDSLSTAGYLQEYIHIDTSSPQEVVDVTEQVVSILQKSVCVGSVDLGGTVTISSQHTTCALTVNENEHFLKRDMISYLNSIVPRDGVMGEGYLHNDLASRPATERDRQAIERNDCGGFRSVEEFMENEPINAHAHIQAMLLGNSVTLGFRVLESGSAGARSTASLCAGIWQSVLFVELDGPRRNRRVSVTAQWPSPE